MKNTRETLTLERTKPRGGKPGKGVVLYGWKQIYNLTGDLVDLGSWVEKWFPNEEMALNYCRKWYQKVEVKI